MSITRITRQRILAAAAALTFLPFAAHAVTATGTVRYTETDALATSTLLTISPVGGTTGTAPTFTLGVASAGVSGNALTSFATTAGQGLTITSPSLAGKSAQLSNFTYNFASSTINFALLMNGTSSSTGSFSVTSPSSISFDAAGNAAFTLSGLFLSQATSSTILNGLGLSLFVSAASLSAIDFGKMDVTAKVATAVPEPTTYALVAFGLASAGFMARRRSDRA